MKEKIARRSIVAGALAWLYRLLNCRRRWRLGRIIMDLILRCEGGQMCSVTARKLLREDHGVDIGDYSYGPCFEPGFFPPEVTIGNYVSIAAGVRIVNENHTISNISTHPFFSGEIGTRKTLQIGDDVWIGFNALILPGCTQVGNGAVIGAGSVVTKDVPPYAVVAGNPAKVLRFRFEEDIRSALASSDWSRLPEQILAEVRKECGIQLDPQTFLSQLNVKQVEVSQTTGNAALNPQ